MTGLSRLLQFLAFLQKQKIPFSLAQHQPDGIAVSFALVGVRLEVEFFEDHLEFSQFRGDESVSSDETELRALIDELWR